MGETVADLERPGAAFREKLAALDRGSFVYFVVRDDSFDVFRRARDLAHARGLATGWHPVEGGRPIRMSARGALGKRVQ